MDTTELPEPSAPSLPPVGRRPRLRRTLWALAVVALLVAADLWSKSAVFAWLDVHWDELPLDDHGLKRQPLIGDWLALMKNYNYGAAFGKLGEIPYILVGGRIAAVLLLLGLIWRVPFGQRMYLCSLVLILSGAIGNLYDNLAMEPNQPGKPFGPVRDFIDVYFGVWKWHFPTFNIADSCISVGAVLLLLSGFGGGGREADGEQPLPADASPGE